MAELKDLIVNGQSRLVGDTTYKTHAAGTSDTRLASTAFVQNAIAAIPGATDEKVKQTASTSSSNFPLLASSETTPTSGNSYYSVFDDDIYITPNAGLIHATTGMFSNVGSTTYPVTNGYFTNINGVALGSTPKFTDTTYTFAEGSTDGAFSVTPLGGQASSISVHNAVTSSSTLTANTVILGNGNKTVTSLSNGTNGQILKISSNVPTWGYAEAEVVPFTVDTSGIFPQYMIALGISNAIDIPKYYTAGSYELLFHETNLDAYIPVELHIEDVGATYASQYSLNQYYQIIKFNVGAETYIATRSGDLSGTTMNWQHTNVEQVKQKTYKYNSDNTSGGGCGFFDWDIIDGFLVTRDVSSNQVVTDGFGWRYSDTQLSSDTLYGGRVLVSSGTSGKAVELSAGTTGQVLKQGASGLEWGTVSSTDEKVKQSTTATSAFHPILGAYAASPTSGTDGQAYYNSNIAINTTTNTIKVSACQMTYDSTEECMKFTFS